MFVIVADHTASGRGKTDLPVEKFLIPLIIHAPGHVAAARIDTLASQIDVAPQSRLTPKVEEVEDGATFTEILLDAPPAATRF